MIVDTSALLAILFDEPDAERYARALADADTVRLSAGSFVEAAIVVIEPVTEEQAHIARQAYTDFGKGRHPASLNFGDCFAYALARATAEPLLFKGEDFGRTDITPALPSPRKSSQQPRRK